MVFFLLTQTCPIRRKMVYSPKAAFMMSSSCLKTFPLLPYQVSASLGHQALRWCPFILVTLFSDHQCRSLASLRCLFFECQVPLVPFYPFTWGVFSQPNSVHSRRLSSGFFSSFLEPWDLGPLLLHQHPCIPLSLPLLHIWVIWFYIGLVVFSHMAYFPNKLKPLHTVDSALFSLYIAIPSKAPAHCKCSLNI